jgi:ferredoxin-thioredoxin reductase catalytic subunit
MIDDAAVDKLFRKLDADAEQGGYHLNPDREFTLGLARGLLVNESRYGYPSCPCRLASGIADEDRDIVCPCDYRDPDLEEYGACYCALYVTLAVRDGTAKLRKVPERRGSEAPRVARPSTVPTGTRLGTPAYPIWRCRVCGYLCAREAPPEVCPICKARKDRFERFW